MEAPTIGGVRVRKGNGETVRLARGASLTDFAEKIGVDAAALVQMLFSLGEMVTATESVNAETLDGADSDHSAGSFPGTPDLNHLNNANMNTPPDGTRPRMRMYFWSSGLSLTKVESPPALAGVPLLPGTVPGPSSPGRVHRRQLRVRCRCVSRGTCKTCLGKAFGREQSSRSGGSGTSSPRSHRSSDRFPSHALPERDRWTTNSIVWP
jgi:hypothetical protein